MVVAYASIYGHTEVAANILANTLADKGVKNIKVYDVSKTDPSYIISDAFKYSTLVFASITYNNEIFPKMEALLHEVAAHNIQNRDIALIENGSWGPSANKKMKAILEKLKNCNFIEEEVTIKSALKEDSLNSLNNLADQIIKSL